VLFWRLLRHPRKGTAPRFITKSHFTISAGTLVEAAESLVARGARSVMAAVTHGVFAEAIRRIHHHQSISGLFQD
jgi:phosphoribosylpyrophosphate synthetase